MRKFLDAVLKGNGTTTFILEAEVNLKPKVDLADKSDLKPKIDLAEPTNLGSLAAGPQQGRAAAQAPERLRTQAQQNVRTRGPTDTQSVGHMASLLGSGIEDDVFTDDEVAAQHHQGMATTYGEPIPTNPENLPDIVRDFTPKTPEDLPDVLDQAGVHFYPEFTQVKHLPGYMQQAIRGLGRHVFRQFTDTPIEDIQCLCTFVEGVSEDDVKMMMKWVQQNGIRDDSAHIDFSQVMPGYKAETQLWNAADFSFLLVKDNANYYVYAWPEGRGVHLTGSKPAPQLESRKGKIKQR